VTLPSLLLSSISIPSVPPSSAAPTNVLALAEMPLKRSALT
jgi:hypothetical protein